MVIEFLTFRVAPADLPAWLDLDERHWTRFLERQDGFVRKEVWRSVDDESTVHAVIWWASQEQWRAIPQPVLDEVTAAMGPHERSASCVAYELLRPR